MRNLLKTIFLLACNFASILSGKKSAPAILMYHSFDSEGWKYGVSPRDLERQLEYLLQHHNVISIYRMYDWLRGEDDIQNNAVSITIDDGYVDTYEVFFPLAKKYQIQFTLFLTTDLGVKEKLGNLERPTVEQLQEMNRSGLMTLGLHGHTHTNFPDVLAEGKEQTEIINSTEWLQEMFNIQVTAVAYPAGRSNERVFSYFKDRGFVIGCTTRPGFVKQGVDPLKLPRIGVDRATSMALFKLRLKPGFELYLTVTNRLKSFLRLA